MKVKGDSFRLWSLLEIKKLEDLKIEDLRIGRMNIAKNFEFIVKIKNCIFALFR